MRRNLSGRSSCILRVSTELRFDFLQFRYRIMQVVGFFEDRLEKENIIDFRKEWDLPSKKNERK